MRLALEMLFAPFDAAVLEPDFDLRLAEVERGGQVIPLRAHHVLLTFKLLLQPLQLLRREDGTHAFGFDAQTGATGGGTGGVMSAVVGGGGGRGVGGVRWSGGRRRTGGGRGGGGGRRRGVGGVERRRGGRLPRKFPFERIQFGV